MINDFVKELKTALEKRRANHVASLISSPNERLAGRIAGIDEALSALDSIRRDFLAKSDDEDQE